MTTLTVNDFFCGAGGMGLGFKNAGFRLGGAWDFDKYAVESYGYNVSPKVKQADITQMIAADVPHSDVWTFGFPCQDISVAGNQAGMIKGETRSGLFYEIIRLLGESKDKPKIILAENVKAVKKYLPEIEKEYAEQGYKMYKVLYNSKYWGVPQNRERYFVVGVHESIEKEFVFPTQQTDYIPRLKTILEPVVDDKYYVNPEKTKSIISQVVGKLEQYKLIDDQGRLNKEHRLHDISPTIKAEEHGNNKKIVLHVKQATKLGYDVATEGDSINLSHPNSKTRRGRVGHQVAQTLLTGSEQVVVEQIPFPVMEKGEGYTVTTRTHAQPVLHGMDRKQGGWVLEDRVKIRRLTPREYARLQGFSDDFEIIVSDAQAYKQFGNAVSVNVSQAIAERIKMFLLSL